MSRRVTTDVDIDVFDRDRIISTLPCVMARIDRPNGVTERHPTGVYFQNIPRDPSTNMAELDHKIAADQGYFKVDLLNVNLYSGVRDESHLIELMDREPPWDFLQFQEISDQLFHLKGYSHLLRRYCPKSVEDIAMILAIIRPSKAYLQNSSWENIRSHVWTKPSDAQSYQFSRSHGIAYSLVIVVNLNLLVEKMLADD